MVSVCALRYLDVEIEEFLTFAVETAESFRGASTVDAVRLVTPVLCSLELFGMVVDEDCMVLLLPVETSLEGSALVFEDAAVLFPLNSKHAFLSALILWAFTPARVASTGATKILTTDATNIAKKNEAFDGLYPKRRGMLIEVR